MIVFLCGKDSYRRLVRKRFYIAQFEKKYGLPAEALDGTDEDAPLRLQAASRSQSLFETKKLLVFEDVFEIEPKKLLPPLKEFLDNKSRSLLISADKKPVKALDLLLKKPVVTEEFEELKDAAWLKFAATETKRLNVKLEPSALAFLADVYRGDSWGLATELEKLAAAPKTLTRKDLEGSGLEPEKNYFALVQTLRAPAARERLGALQTLFALEEPGAKIFNILAALWPQKTVEFARYDQAIKFGRMDFEEALLELALG